MHFMAHYPNSSLDEVHWANEVCKYTNTKLNSVTIDPLNSGYSLMNQSFRQRNLI